MTKPIAGILGGSGFVGSVIANRLINRGYAVNIYTRKRDYARHLWLLPDTRIIELDPANQEQLNAAVSGCAVLINMIGILNEKRDNGEGFHRAHTEITARAVKACKSNNIPRLLQMSAINADSFASSYYLRSKGEAEKLVLSEQNSRFSATIFRPSVIFGPGDKFINRFARLLKMSPGFFPLACAHARFQPVFVGDVADAFLEALEENAAAGQRFDLGGPNVMSLQEIVSYVAAIIDRPTLVIPLGRGLSSLQANLLEYFPGKPLSRDNLRSMQEDSVCRPNNALDELGIRPTPMDQVVPQYLGGERIRNRYYGYRSEARRDD
ncbi:MAG: complex I NDUFA9 subunit family protein [Proteobacteria bacterium]|nr:complex I NDUFA9 subunit family protein [Pseudomonadota bacterium]